MPSAPGALAPVRLKRRFRILAKTCRRLGEGCDIDALRRHESIRADHDMVPFDHGFDAKAWSCREVDRLRADCSDWFAGPGRMLDAS